MFFFPITRAARTRHKQAKAIYEACMVQARQALFYANLSVPDTLDGRFDLLSLHVGLVVNRLVQEKSDKAKLGQALFDVMFVNIDQTCREIGIGDLSVPRHMKRMMTAFKGRAVTYGEALQQDATALKDALARNLYGTAERPEDSVLDAMAGYVVSLNAALQAQTYEDISAGHINFPAIDTKGVQGNVAQSQAA